MITEPELQEGTGKILEAGTIPVAGITEVMVMAVVMAPGTIVAAMEMVADVITGPAEQITGTITGTLRKGIDLPFYSSSLI